MKKKYYFPLLISLIALLTSSLSAELEFVYHDYSAIISTLSLFKQKFPNKVHLYSIGNTTQERSLLVIAIADSHPEKHILLRPEVKYIGKQHLTR